MMQDVFVKLNTGLPWQEEGTFHQQIGLKFKEATVKVLRGSWLCMVLELGQFGK
jgi:hypothetical protein